MLEYLKKYEDKIYNCKDKEEIKNIVKKMFYDDNISDVEFDNTIYDCVIDKLKQFNIYFDDSKNSYEEIVKENY